MSKHPAQIQLAGSVIRQITFAPSQSFRISMLRAPATDQERQVSTQYELHFSRVLCCRLNFQAEPWLEIRSYEAFASSVYLQEYVQRAGEAKQEPNEIASELRHFQFTLEEGSIDLISQDEPQVLIEEMRHVGQAKRADSPKLHFGLAKEVYEEGELTCDFCGRGQSDVFKIIQGPSTSICDGCVATCSRLIGDSKAME
jgi:hypothetical protein